MQNLDILEEKSNIYDTYWNISLGFIVCVGRQRIPEQCILKYNHMKNIAEVVVYYFSWLVQLKYIAISNLEVNCVL